MAESKRHLLIWFATSILEGNPYMVNDQKAFTGGN
jgi:hypothetical protein